MGLLSLGLVVVIVGLLLAYTAVGDMLGVSGALGLTLVQIGWLLILVGIVLAIVHFVVGPRWGWRGRRAYRY